MASFYDYFGTLWEIRLTLGTVFDFQNETGISLLNGKNLPNDLAPRLLPFLLREKIAQRYRTAREIKEAFPKSIRRRAKEALAEELVRFFPKQVDSGGSTTVENNESIEDQLWKIGGILNLDIRSFRLSELLLMARGAQEERWERLSTLMALLINIHRGKNTPAVYPRDYNPFRKKEQIATLSKSELTAIFRNFKNREGNNGQ